METFGGRFYLLFHFWLCPGTGSHRIGRLSRLPKSETDHCVLPFPSCALCCFEVTNKNKYGLRLKGILFERITARQGKGTCIRGRVLAVGGMLK